MGAISLSLMLSPLYATESTTSNEGTIDIYQNSNFISSKVMTFDELVITNARDRNIPVEQAEEELLAGYIQTHSSDVSY